MKKQVLILLLFSFFFLFFNPAKALEPVAGGSAVLKKRAKGVQADSRAQKLKAYLANHNSPLAAYAENFVKAADLYGLDWKLVPAIAGVESTFGKHIPFKSYNAYGWANGAYQFQSWEQSIDHVSKFLKENYINKGLNTPQKIGPVYAPPSQTWAGKVIFFTSQIENFQEKKLSLTI